MRKLWCAGAIAGGILLFGASPALADSADGQPLSPLNAVLGENPIPSDPLSGSPLIDTRILSVKPGSNSIGRASGLASPPQRIEKQKPKVLPAADVVSGTLPAADPRHRTPGTVGKLPNPAPAAVAAGELAFSALPFDSLMNSGSTVITALGPDGLPVAQNNDIAGLGPGTSGMLGTSGTSRTENARTDVPLVGGIGTAGLGGALPVSGVQQQLDGIGADVSGLPIGGTPVTLRPGRSARPATPDPDATPPATPGTVPPATSGASPAAVPDAPASGVSSSTTAGGPGAATASVPGAGIAGSSGAGTAGASGAGTAGASGAGTSGASGDAGAGAASGAGDAAKPSADGTSSTHHHSAADAPSKSKSSGVAARDKIDDPRLLEEPTEGLN